MTEKIRFTLEDGTTLDFTVDVDRTCSFCAGRIIVDGDECAIIHTSPPCQIYIDTEDPCDFLEMCRKREEN